MIYSEKKERFYRDIEEVVEDLDEGEELKDLELVICEKNYAGHLCLDYFCDSFPDEEDTDSGGMNILKEAVTTFNKTMKGVVLSWSPTEIKFRMEK